MYAFLIVSGYLLINLFLFFNFRAFCLSLIPRGSGNRLLRIGVNLISVLLYWIPAMTMVVTGFCPDTLPGFRTMKTISNFWIVIMIYAGIFFLLMDLTLLGFRIFGGRNAALSFLIRRAYGILAVIVPVIMVFYGNYHAQDIQVVNYDVEIDKNGGNLDSLKIALITDTHLGYNADLSLMQKMVEKINQEQVDIVLFGGDIFDNNFDAIENPDLVADTLKSIQSTYGSYGVLGNHDIDEQLFCGFNVNSVEGAGDDNYLAFLEKADIQLIEDQEVLIADSFYLVGRKDAMREWRRGQSRYSISSMIDLIGRDKPIIVLDHEPLDVQNTANAGADLLLSGHTHNGQIFPGNLLIGLVWKYAHGYYTCNDLQIVVSAGVGTWGPYVRSGADSEVVIVNTTFK